MRGGGSTPLCSRTLHVQRSRLFIAVPVRDAYLSGCDGNRTRYGLLAKPWPVDLRPHPTILFWLGNHRPRGGRTPFCWSGASGSRGARLEPPINAGVTTRVPCRQGSFRYPRRCCRRAGRRYPKLVRFRYSQGNFRYPGTLRIWR